MTEMYVNLLKDRIMQNTLGNTAKTLTEIVESLMLEHTDHQKEIALAYQYVSRELTGYY